MQQVFKIIEDMGTYTTTQLYDKINELSTQKEELRQVLLSKGADVSANVLLDDYPSIIDGIYDHPDIRLEYIANGTDSTDATRNVYYDTGYVSNDTTTIDITAACYYINKSVNAPLFSGVDSNWKGLSIFAPANDGKIEARLGNSYVAGPSAVSNTKYYISTAVNSTTGYLIVNGQTYSGSTSSVYGTTSAYLFAYNVNGNVNTTVSYSGMKIYSLQIYTNGIKARDYIPVLHWNGSQYVASFYDKVNDNYIYNLGTQTPDYKIR